MTIIRGGQTDSGLDRALENALRLGLDETLVTGEIWKGERDAYPDPIGQYDPKARPWQRPLTEKREPPATAEPLIGVVRKVLVRSTRPASGDPTQREPDQDVKATGATPHEDGSPRPAQGPSWTEADREEDARRHLSTSLGDHMATVDRVPTEDERQAFKFRFRDELTGVVMVHGIGPHLAGQTLLDWTRPVIALLGDARVADPHLAPLETGPGAVSDPVFKANIDFSGETFPVIQLRIPKRTDVPPADPRANERRWIFTETWWASEVRPPALRTMIDWLGEQGGVGRIVQGIQENMLGRGPFGRLAGVSLQAFVSVIVSFVLLVFLTLLGISRLIPFGPLKNAVALQFASSFLTDWFGGARTLLRDPAQSANVRSRLVATIKALRAYGCRHVVIVAHSGGTLVSLMTLTDPAYPRIRVEKLITIGEALNLGWRLEDPHPDDAQPTPPKGNRMRGDLAVRQRHLQWRDFWATHDPAPSGWPRLPPVDEDPGPPRFTAERVYNRMSIGEDHGAYWDNDEHFLIPLIREIDAATGDRGSSRFYSDAAESLLRARRKERVGLLALWRRAILALPVMAIAAAMLVSAGGSVRDAGDVVLTTLSLVPGHELLADGGRSLAQLGDTPVFGGLPRGPREVLSWHRLYDLGLLVLQIVFLLLLAFAVVPGRVDRLWLGRPIGRVVLLAFDIAIGIGALASILAAWAIALGDWSRFPTATWEVLRGSGIGGLVAVIGALWILGRVAKLVRAKIAELDGASRIGWRFGRDALIVVSAAFLGSVLLLLTLAAFAVVVVLAGNDAVPDATDTRRFVVGAIGVLLAFQVLGRLGAWRWDSWDVRERRALRLRPHQYPFRYWTYLLASMLIVAAVAGALLVALRGQSSALPLLGLWILVIIVLSIGKDVVDNDIDADSQDKGGGAAQPSPVIPPPTGPAA